MDEHKITDPAVLRFMAVGDGARLRTFDLLKQQGPEQAFGYLGDFQRDNPGQYDAVEDVAIDLCLILEHYEEAFRRVAGMLNKRGFAQLDRYLELSPATSARGRIYPGQLEYCEKALRTTFLSNAIPANTDPLPGGDESARSVSILSCLALGMHNGGQMSADFCEAALKIDSKNLFAAKRAIEVYVQMGRFSAVRRVATDIVKNLPPGTSRDEFQRIFARNSGLKDTDSKTSITP